MRCLAKSPPDRYPDTRSLAQDLDRCADAANWSPAHAAAWWQGHPGQTLEAPARCARRAGEPGTPLTLLVPDGRAAAMPDRLL